MKRSLIVLSVGLICILSGCSDKSKESGGMTAEEKKNLEVSREISKAFGSGDASMIDSLVAPDFIDHTADRGDVGRDSLKKMITTMKQYFPDMNMEQMKEMADGDLVFSQMRFTGTSKGDMGMPPGPYDMRAIQVTRFKDGKAVEHWEYMDMRDVVKMMGQMTPADSSKMK